VWNNARKSMPKFMQSQEIFDILEIDKTFVRYRLIRVLQFVRPSDGKLQVQVYDGSDRSLGHEAALLRMEAEEIRALRAEKKIGPQHGADPAERLIEPQVYAAAKQLAVEVPRLQEEIEQRERKIRDAEEQKRSSRTKEELAQANQDIGDLQAEVAQLRAQIESFTQAAPRTEVLPMAEHRPRLLKALQDAQRRIIIVSPWLTRKAVNWELRDGIAHTVERGVQVIIGYGFSEEGDREEEITLSSLERIQKGRGGRNLKLERIGDSHAKVVVCDDAYLITTSFNWLSFAGRSDWGNRVEFGTLTSDRKAITQMLDELSTLFKQIPISI